MANRAYLYCRDDPTWFDFPDDDEPYFDSRHCVPISWFFFYCPADLVRHPVTYDSSTWHEPRLVAPKMDALSRFDGRRDLLERMFQQDLGADAFDSFTQTLRDRASKYLLLDPSEIIEDDVDDCIRYVTNALELIDQSSDSSVIFDALSRYWVRIDDRRYDMQLQVIGATYS